VEGTGVTDAEKVAQAQQLIELRESMPHFFEIYALQAKMRMAKFKALVKEGFTESQAVELCKEL
jgi:hypothetical protein